MENFETTFAESVQSSKDYLHKSLRDYKEKEAEQRQKDKNAAMWVRVGFGMALIAVTYTLGYYTPR